MIRMLKNCFLAMMGLATIAVPAFAHHGNASYDAEKSYIVKGTVTEFVWSNPHVFIKVDVKDDKGEVKLNGKLTLGENTADNGGLKLAYMALLDIIGSTPLKPIDGYTPQQRFFLAFGQIWCQNVTTQEARKRALTDPHSPGEWRVNGSVQNSAAFQQAFGCEAGQPMVSANACRVW